MHRNFPYTGRFFLLCLISLGWRCGQPPGDVGGRPASPDAQPQATAPSSAAGSRPAVEGEASGTPPGASSSEDESPARGPTGLTPPGPPPGSVDTVCEVVRLTADPQIPQMMIVLDRSGSMGPEAGDRWDPSVSAVRRITEELESRIDFGLTLFPDPKNQILNDTLTELDRCLTAADIDACLNEVFDRAGGALDDPACAPGPVAIPAGPDHAARIAEVLQMTVPLGGTPTAETLEGLLQTYATAPTDPDLVESPRYVLLVTDGQPTCPAGAGAETTPADIEASNRAIEELAAARVKTYVIGYDTRSAGNEALAAVLDGFAQRGATGDTEHRPVEDEDSLLGELKRIAGEIATCSLLLEDPPASAEFVLVTLDGEPLALDAPDGWSLIDGTTIQLSGASCETFRSGPHAVEASVQCEIVAPQ